VNAPTSDPTAALAAGMADQLRRITAQIDAGALTAPTATRHRLEGALVALEALAGEPPSLLERLGVPGGEDRTDPSGAPFTTIERLL
jgi:hypothetical protein